LDTRGAGLWACHGSADTHSDPASIKASLGKYWKIGAALLVFTVITVAVNLVHLSSVALAITIALIIACMKGSMVAAVFMHLSNEKKWIYGALLLTAIFVAVLLSVPLFTTLDTIGTHQPAVGIPETHGSGH
jgi:caa(3)-type oxidase subunit IV